MNKKIIRIIVLTGIFALLAVLKMSGGKKPESSAAMIHPVSGGICACISTTGMVEPQNRLEIKPPIGGRIEKILVKEGDQVKAGDILALMSSTERAALLDAAHLNGGEEPEYWKKVYNATPLIAPIDAKVIVRTVEPGQTVVASDAVIVLSDRLIIKADVDEVDIGRVKEGQKAVIGLDAYPRIKINGIVDHISYESTVVNNVTIYEADIIPETVPGVFRSGMSANVDIITESKDNVLLIPLKAVIKEKDKDFVLLKHGNAKAVKHPVTLGIFDDENVEVISGLSAGDAVVISTQKYLLPVSKELGGNPFMPKFNREKK